MSGSESSRPHKRALTAALAFYALVAFEFFYMASPFAAYFYGVYGPGLEALSHYPALNWTITFFLPHIVAETQSVAVNWHNAAGAVLMVLGLSAFIHAAWQIYKSKLTTPQAIATGLYRYVRHPQYLGLMIAGFGMVLIWPRFLVLIAFVVMAFIYGLLASIEEAICQQSYAGYAAYRDRTGMFLPRYLEAPLRAMPRPRSRLARGLTWSTAFVIILATALAGAVAVKRHTISAIQGIFTDEAAFVSIGRLPDERLLRIIDIANADERVQVALAGLRTKRGSVTPRVLAYVLPTGFYVSEVPMHLPTGVRTGHTWPKDHDPRLYKVVLTEAVLPATSNARGREIVAEAYNKQPIIEAHIDLQHGRVTAIHAPPKNAFYSGLPVPVF